MTTNGDLEARRFVAQDLAALVKRCIERTRSIPEVEKCRIEFECEQDCRAEVIPEQIYTVLAKLITNSAEAKPDCRVLVRLTGDEETFGLGVHDDGPGIPPTRHHQIFEPNFTTKTGNAGMGLLAVKSIAAVHSGDVKVVDSRLGGASFRFTMPVRQPA